MILGWFSAGVTSAVACKIAIEEFGRENVSLWYFETGAAHFDNARFIKECEDWYGGAPINKIKTEKYDSPLDVILSTGWVNGPRGARCTLELKKEMRYKIQRDLPGYGAQVLGYEFDRKQINRAIRFTEQYPEALPLFPLIERGFTKDQCAGVLKRAGIEIPEMYRLGYPNNNCIGCVKGGAGYWNKIRTDFPYHFYAMAKAEREVGATCLRKDGESLYLDQLDPEAGRGMKIVMPDCGSFCDLEFVDLEHRSVGEILAGTRSIADLYPRYKKDALYYAFG